MKRQSYPITKSVAFTAGTQVEIDLPKSGMITQLTGTLRLNVTVGGGGGVPLIDPLWRVIKSMRVLAGNALNFVTFTDGRQWGVYNYFLYKGQNSLDALPVAPGVTANVRAEFPIHLGRRPYDAYDPTCVIPTPNLQNPVLQITWGTAADLGAGYTINSGEMKFTCNEIAFNPSEDIRKLWPMGIPMPRFEPRILSIDAIYANLGLEQDAPIGGTLIRTVMMVLNAGDGRADTEIDNFGLKFPRRSSTPYQRDWYAFKNEGKSRYGITTSLDGCGVLDWSQVSGREVGLDLSGKTVQVGDAKLGFTSLVAGGRVHLIHFMMN